MANDESLEEVQRHARALADPSRFRIFTHIANSDAPVGVAELTELLRFNHNAIRHHLAQLLDSGLVTEEREVRNRPGRPRLLYSAGQNVLSPFGDSAIPQERLSRLLLEMVTSSDSAYVVGKRSAEKFRAEQGEAPSVDWLMQVLSVERFEPELNGDEIVLQRCAVANVAREGQSIVCELHRGLIDGAVDRSVNLQPEKDPTEGGCRVTLPSGLT